MRRRDLSKLLLTSAAGAGAAAALPVQNAQAQTACASPPCIPRTREEIAANVTPKNLAFAPGDVRRYGAVGSDTGDDTAAFQDAIAVGRHSGDVYIPAGRWRTGSLNIGGFGGRIHGDHGQSVVEFVNAGGSGDPDSAMQAGFFAGARAAGGSTGNSNIEGLAIIAPANGAGILLLNFGAVTLRKLYIEGGRYSVAVCGAVGFSINEVRCTKYTLAGIGLLNLSAHPAFMDEGQPGQHWNDTITIDRCEFFDAATTGPFCILDHGSKTPFSQRIITGCVSTVHHSPYFYVTRKNVTLTMTGCYTEVTQRSVTFLGASDAGNLPGTLYPRSNFPNGFSYGAIIKNNAFTSATEVLRTDGVLYCEFAGNVVEASAATIFDEVGICHIVRQGITSGSGTMGPDRVFFGNIFRYDEPPVIGGAGFARGSYRVVPVVMPPGAARIRLSGKLNGRLRVTAVYGGSAGSPVQTLVAHAYLRMGAGDEVTVERAYLAESTNSGGTYYGFDDAPGLAFQPGASHVDIAVKGHGGGGNASKTVLIEFQGWTSSAHWNGRHTIEPIGAPPTYLSLPVIANATDTASATARLNDLLAVLRQRGVITG